MTDYRESLELRLQRIERVLEALASRERNNYPDNLITAYTPTYLGGTTPGVTTYSIQIGHYCMLASSLCWFSLRVDWTNATGTGLALISLPFTAKNITNFSQPLDVYVNNVTFGGAGVKAAVNPNTANAFLASPNSNLPVTAVNVEAAGTIILSGTYEIEV